MFLCVASEEFLFPILSNSYIDFCLKYGKQLCVNLSYLISAFFSYSPSKDGVVTRFASRKILERCSRCKRSYRYGKVTGFVWAGGEREGLALDFYNQIIINSFRVIEIYLWRVTSDGNEIAFVDLCCFQMEKQKSK